MDKSKKAKAMCDLEKSSREYISIHREIEKELSRQVKIDDKKSDSKPSGFSSGNNSIDYGSLGGN